MPEQLVISINKGDFPKAESIPGRASRTRLPFSALSLLEMENYPANCKIPPAFGGVPSSAREQPLGRFFRLLEGDNEGDRGMEVGWERLPNPRLFPGTGIFGRDLPSHCLLSFYFTILEFWSV